VRPTVYLETTIPSYLTARPSNDLAKAARQAATRLWWDTLRSRCACFVSQLILDEAGRGDLEAARLRLEILDGIPRLDLTDGVLGLAQRLLHRKALPAHALEDALHIAVSAVHRMEYILTWNFRHIANARTMKTIRKVCEEAGHPCSEICTPDQLLEGQR
jgi:hypothetical protein